MRTASPNLHGLTSMSIAHARAALSEVVGRARHGKSPTVLTSRGKPVAAVVPIEDLELIEEALDAAQAAKARAQIAGGESTVAWEQVKAALDAKPAKPSKRK